MNLNNAAATGAGRPIRFRWTVWLTVIAITLLPLLGYGAAQSAGVAPAAAVGSFPSQTVPGESRYVVAHAHTLFQCLGYIYVSAARIRYEVVNPDTDKRHSFDLSRSEIAAIQQWVLLGTAMNAVELRVGRNNYHFWLLPANTDLTRISPAQPSLPNAPASILLAGLQGQPALPAAGVPASQVGVNSATAYPNANPGYPTSGYPSYPVAGGTAPSVAPAYPAAYPSYPPAGAAAPTTPMPDVSWATAGAYPGAYPTYPAVGATPPTAMPNVPATTADAGYPGTYPAYPADGATPPTSMPDMTIPNAAAPASTYPATYPSYPGTAPGAPPPAQGYPYSGVSAPAYPATASVVAPATMPNVVGPNSLAQYVYTAPQGWTATNFSDAITLNNPPYNTNEKCLIQMWAMRPAGMDLQMDVSRAFETVFRAYEPRSRTSDGMVVQQTRIRGSSGQGWDYAILSRPIGMPSNPPGQWETLLGFVMVAKLGTNLAVVSGLSKVPLVSACFGELRPSVWPRYFYSLRFRSWPVNDQSPAMAAKLAGVWISATGNAADRYQFNGNGRYASAAAVQNYNRISSSEVLQTTQGFFGNGSYSLNQNTITFSPDPGQGPPETGLFRLESESHDGGRAWIDVLYLLKKSVVDGTDYEVRYTRN